MSLEAKKTNKKKSPVAQKNSALSATCYSQEGSPVGTLELPSSVFGVRPNPELVHQVVVSFQANRRAGTAHTKNRGEVSGGGKKPWRQKGTGRARHGSIRSPLWVGGGVTFGPRSEKSYAKKINKKMKTRALASVLSQKLRDGEIIFVDKITFPEAKTKAAVKMIGTLAGLDGFGTLARKKRNAGFVALAAADPMLERSFANIAGITLGTVENLNVLDAITYHSLVVVGGEEAIQKLRARIE